MNIWLLIIIGISLSMDTFSLSLSLGTFNIQRKKIILFALIVGIFHFFMPIMGIYLGSAIEKFIAINHENLLFIIFTFIAISMFIDICLKEDKEYNFHFLSMVLYAFSVSIDSLTVGIGLKNIVHDIYFAPFIFAIVSAFFTYLGLYLGKYSYHKLGNLSKVLGLIIMIILAIIHLAK